MYPKEKGVFIIAYWLMTKRYKLSVKLYHKEALRASTIIVEGCSQMQNTS